ncbi:MAG: G5 domain-containing protein [Clostridia bacterium]|nr:G5 domain-containing protein [Clostridia bacterium]
MSSHKQKKHHKLKKAVSFVVMGTVCLTAAVSVAAMTQTVQVTDGDTKVTDTAPKTGVIEIDTAQAEIGKNTVGQPVLKAFNVDSEESNIDMTVKENESVALASNQKAEKENTIQEWCTVTIDLRGKKITKDVPAGTVGDALAYLNIKLTKTDSVNPAKKTEVKDGIEIKITEKKVVEETETKTVKYKTVTKKTSTLEKGKTQVETEGENGEKEVVVEKTYINGKLDSKKEVSSEVTVEPVDKVVLKGTADASERIFKETNDGDNIVTNEEDNTFTDADGEVVSYSKIITGSGTAYTADAGALTSTGRVADYGIVAVNPNIIPYGSKLYIKATDGSVVYGYAIAGDTGGALMDGSAIVDLFYPTLDECIQFGRRDVTIYVVE